VRVLIAEDDAISRRLLETTLARWGHDVVTVTDGRQALQVLQTQDAPPLAILDWMMPEMDGVQVCRAVRGPTTERILYVILLTAKGRKQDIVTGLEAGADDYLVKPFDREELRARLNAGIRILTLEQALAERVRELEDALAHVHELQGLLPICSYCKKVRDDRHYWHEVENYVSRRSGAVFTHGVCPGCRDRILKVQIAELTGRR
jgi:sigma-B regulation protein RsbU (phosphoserine phosphatase)